MDRRGFLAHTGRFATLGAAFWPGLSASGTRGQEQEEGPSPASGPLRVSSKNPRYFCDATGQEVLLVGSHTWNNPVDMGRNEDWNEYTLITRGGQTVLKINGTTMCEVTDRDPRRTPKGHLAVQVHRGPPMKVQFRNIRIRQF